MHWQYIWLLPLMFGFSHMCVVKTTYYTRTSCVDLTKQVCFIAHTCGKKTKHVWENPHRQDVWLNLTCPWFDISPQYCLQGTPVGYYERTDYIRGFDYTYAMRYVRKLVDWRGKSLMVFSIKLIGQPMLYLSEGTLYEMQLDQGGHKVKPTINQQWDISSGF